MGENEIEKEITSAQKLSGKKTDRQKTFQFSSPQDKLPFHWHFTHILALSFSNFSLFWIEKKNLKYFWDDWEGPIIYFLKEKSKKKKWNAATWPVGDGPCNKPIPRKRRKFEFRALESVMREEKKI